MSTHTDEFGVPIEIKVATFAVMLENVKSAVLENMGRQDKVLERIETQVTKTNGRVTKTEEDVRNLQRISAESLESATEMATQAANNRHAIARIKRSLWRFTVTLSILAAVGFGVVWCLDHGILEFKPQNYHASGTG